MREFCVLHGEMMKLLDLPVQMALSNCILNSDPTHDEGEGGVGGIALFFLE